MFGCAVLWGRPCCAIAGEASNAAMPATDKIAFMFNLLFGIVGGGGGFTHITPSDNRAFLMLPISHNHPSAEPAVFVVAFIPASSAPETLIFGLLLLSTAAAGQRTSFGRS